MTKHFRVTNMLRPRLEELEIPVPAVLRRAGLPHGFFEQTRILVSTEQLFALWDAIGYVSNDPAVGLKLNSESRIERFDPIALSTLTNENFAAAVRHIARYKSLCAPEEILHQQEGDEWSIQFRWTQAVDADPQVFLEACFAWMLNIARHAPAHVSLQCGFNLFSLAATSANSNATSAAPFIATRRATHSSFALPMRISHSSRAMRNCWTLSRRSLSSTSN
jgi:hypothetical protein